MNTNHKPITQQELQQLSESYARFHFLRNATIKQANDEAELRGLTEYMATFFIDHASEFIGSIHVLRGEYEPLIGLLGVLARRVSALNESRALMAQQVESAPLDATQASNIIPVKG